MTILAVHHDKGGVGKTAAAVNLAYLAAQTGVKTLICDLDPQSSATYYFRVQPKLKAGKKLFQRGAATIHKNIKATDYEHLDLLPASKALRDLVIRLHDAKHPSERLLKALTPLRAEYGYIVLDCPPGISLLAKNVWTAADLVLIPLVPTPLSIRAYQRLLAYARKQAFDERKGLAFLSMVERRKKLHRDVISRFFDMFPLALRTAIPYAADIEKMGIVRQPVPVFAPRSPAATAYRNLWHECENVDPTRRGVVGC